MARKLYKVFNIFLTIREMQTSTSLRLWSTLVTMAVIRTTKNKHWRGCGVDGVSTSATTSELEPPDDPAIPVLGHYRAVFVSSYRDT